MKRAVWIFVFCIPAIACGQDLQAIRASEAACGQGKGHIRTEVLTGPQIPPQIAPDKSLVYFVNPATWFYVKVSIAADGHWITKLPAISHFAAAMEPGEHHLCVRLELPAGIPDKLESSVLNQKYIEYLGDVAHTQVCLLDVPPSR